MQKCGCVFIGLVMMPALANQGLIPKGYDNTPVMPAIKKMQGEWTWKNFESLPNTHKKQKYPQDAHYFTHQKAREGDMFETTVAFYGSAQKPEFAIIESRAWGAGNAQGVKFTKLEHLQGLSKLTSNCNLKNIHVMQTIKDEEAGDYQQGGDLYSQALYQFNNGQKTLYMASLQATSITVTGSFQTQVYTRSIITPHKAKLPTYIQEFGWNKNAKGKTIKCTITL